MVSADESVLVMTVGAEETVEMELTSHEGRCPTRGTLN